MDQNIRYKLRNSTMLFMLHNNNHNEAIKEQSLNFVKNQPEQTVGLELTCELTFHEGALQLYELF